jgi:hypothetical protein
MNTYTRLIAEKLNITLEEALKIQDFIECNEPIRWSEASSATIIKIAKRVVKSDYAELLGA